MVGKEIMAEAAIGLPEIDQVGTEKETEIVKEIEIGRGREAREKGREESGREIEGSAITTPVSTQHAIKRREKSQLRGTPQNPEEVTAPHRDQGAPQDHSRIAKSPQIVMSSTLAICRITRRKKTSGGIRKRREVSDSIRMSESNKTTRRNEATESISSAISTRMLLLITQRRRASRTRAQLAMTSTCKICRAHQMTLLAKSMRRAAKVDRIRIIRIGEGMGKGIRSRKGKVETPQQIII